MKLIYQEEHFTCSNYIPKELNLGFKIFNLSSGEIFEKERFENNIIVFLLKGEIEIKCDDSEIKKIADKEFFLITQASSLSCCALTDSYMIVYVFFGHISMLCEYSKMLNYSSDFSDFKYNLKVLKFNKPLEVYIDMLEMYLRAGVNCVHMHELKKTELFLLLRMFYTKKDVYELFYPILGSDVDFKSKVLLQYQIGYNTKIMANQMAMSTIHFSRKFREEFGETFYRWTLAQKALAIRRKLSSPSITISDVINEFKFSSPSHFHKFCINEFGCTPAQFLRQLRCGNTR